MDTLVAQLVNTGINGQEKTFVTFLPTETINSTGLKESTIAGIIKNPHEKLEPNNFIENGAFKETIKSFFDYIASKDNELIDSAKNSNDEWIYIIDQRNKDPLGNVPPDDIIGVFQVVDRKLSEFKVNPNYRLMTVDGILNLGKDKNKDFTDYLISVANHTDL